MVECNIDKFYYATQNSHDFFSAIKPGIGDADQKAIPGHL